MELIAEISKAWGWVGITPDRVVGDNDFGNLIIKDVDGRYWRLCPEDLYCKVVACDRAELDALSQSQEFLQDWNMRGLVEQAKERLGSLRPGYKYCLKIPGVLGGVYGGANLASIPLRELVAVSGHIAREIEGLPDGAQVRLKISE
ncbi:MAG: DUF1851 domain-containing protein [Lysobacterales bacterium]